MKDHSGCRRAYIRLDKAWYVIYKTSVQETEISFGMYMPNNGTSGELYMRWDNINGALVPKLEAYGDSWSVLALFTDVIQKLGEVDDKKITPDEFVAILLSCGFVDDTMYNRP